MSKNHSRTRGKGKTLGYRTPSPFRADPQRRPKGGGTRNLENKKT